MDFQRYYDGVGLIVQNKINNAFVTCPLCNDSAQWEIVFDFKGDVICVLAKCPHCGGVIKTIFDFANNQPITTFTVSILGNVNHNHLEQGINYSLPTSSIGQTCGEQNRGTVQQPSNSEDTGAVGWGILGYFVPIVGFILWLVWKDSKPKTARSAGIGCLVSVCVSTAVTIFTIFIVAIWFGFIGAIAGFSYNEYVQPINTLLSMMC